MALPSDDIESDYIPTSTIENFHSAPRFGHTNDISKIASTNREEQTDYIRGLLFLPTFLFVFFFLWTSIIIALKCAGRKRTGFLSGHTFPHPQEHKGDSKRPFVFRSLFLFFSILLVTFAVVFIFKGAANMDNTVNSFQNEHQKLRSLASDGLRLSDELLGVYERAVPIRKQLLDEVMDDVCPGINEAYNSETTSSKVNEFRQHADVAKNYLTLLDNFKESTIKEPRNALEEFIEIQDNIDNTLDEINVEKWFSWLSYFMIPVIMFTIFLLLGTIVVSCPFTMARFQSFNSYVVLPLFALTMIICVIMLLILGPIGIINADICFGRDEIGSLEGTIFNILKEQNVDVNSREYILLAHYISGCQTPYPFEEVRGYEYDIQSVLSSAVSLKMFLQENIENLQLVCGRDLTSLSKSIETGIEELNILVNVLSEAFNLITCEAIYEIYQPLTHDVICTHSISAVVWMFSSLVIITTSGMVMITLRAAWKDNRNVNIDFDDVEVITPKIPK